MTAVISGQADIGLMGPETGVYVCNEGKEDHAVIIGQLTKRDGSFLLGKTKDEDFSWEKLKGTSIIGGRKGRHAADDAGICNEKERGCARRGRQCAHRRAV